MQLLEFSGWLLLGRCYAVTRVFWVVASRVLLCGCEGVLYGWYAVVQAHFYGVAMRLIGYLGWLLLGCCYVVARMLLCSCWVFWMVIMEFLKRSGSLLGCSGWLVCGS